MKNSILSTAVLLLLAACTGKNNGTNSAAVPNSDANSQVYTKEYDLKEQGYGCHTQRSFSGNSESQVLESFCLALANDELNNNCNTTSRAILFGEQCAPLYSWAELRYTHKPDSSNSSPSDNISANIDQKLKSMIGKTQLLLVKSHKVNDAVNGVKQERFNKLVAEIGPNATNYKLQNPEFEYDREILKIKDLGSSDGYDRFVDLRSSEARVVYLPNDLTKDIKIVIYDKCSVEQNETDTLEYFELCLKNGRALPIGEILFYSDSYEKALEQIKLSNSSKQIRSLGSALVNALYVNYTDPSQKFLLDKHMNNLTLLVQSKFSVFESEKNEQDFFFNFFFIHRNFKQHMDAQVRLQFYKRYKQVNKDQYDCTRIVIWILELDPSYKEGLSIVLNESAYRPGISMTYVDEAVPMLKKQELSVEHQIMLIKTETNYTYTNSLLYNEILVNMKMTHAHVPALIEMAKTRYKLDKALFLLRHLRSDEITNGLIAAFPTYEYALDSDWIKLYRDILARKVNVSNFSAIKKAFEQLTANNSSYCHNEDDRCSINERANALLNLAYLTTSPELTDFAYEAFKRGWGNKNNYSLSPIFKPNFTNRHLEMLKKELDPSMKSARKYDGSAYSLIQRLGVCALIGTPEALSYMLTAADIGQPYTESIVKYLRYFSLTDEQIKEITVHALSTSDSFDRHFYIEFFSKYPGAAATQALRDMLVAESSKDNKDSIERALKNKK